MEDTYNVKAIILSRQPRGECDGRAVVYSREAGKLELVARGVKKIKSKLAGHLEPFNLADIMAVRGQKYDYVGAAVSQECFSDIKSDLTKLAAAGRAVKLAQELTKPGVPQVEIFELLKDYLETLEAARKDSEILPAFFTLKLLSALGHAPELSRCLSCAAKIQPGKNRLDLARGGLICAKCAKPGDGNQLAISDDSIKLLRLALKGDFRELAKIKVEKKLAAEIGEAVEKFLRYNF
ncbi:MAG: DNA repair protein RecO [Patescibacteria group bacterium]|nr:DNA repair protein RecO [Patescibacteria group bacterium]